MIIVNDGSDTLRTKMHAEVHHEKALVVDHNESRAALYINLFQFSLDLTFLTNFQAHENQ